MENREQQLIKGPYALEHSGSCLSLTVVVGADALADSQMAALANWKNLSETTFLLRPTSPLADYRVRIFTPQRELPFAGHPTLGGCHVWHASGGIPKGDDVVQECEIGLVRIRRGAGRLSFAAPKLRRTGPLEPGILARVIEGLRLTPEAIVGSNWVDNGPGWLAVLLRSRDEVLAIHPDYAVLSGLRVGVVGAWDSIKDGSEAQFEVRAFTAAGYEDPVTGSLNAGLAQWLIGTGVAPSSYVAPGFSFGQDGPSACGAGRVRNLDRWSGYNVHRWHIDALKCLVRSGSMLSKK